MSVWKLVPWIGGSLRQRLALLFAVILLPPTVLSLYLAWDSFAEHTKRAKLSVRQFAVLSATYERKFFEDTRKELQRLSNEPPVQTEAVADCNALLARNLESAPQFAGLALYDPGGRLICGTAASLEDAGDRNWFRDVLLFRNFTISDYTFTPDSPFPVIVAALAVYDEKGQFQGILSASIELYWLTAFLREARLPSEGVFFLLDSNANVLASSATFLDNTNPALPKKEPRASQGKALASVVGEDLIKEVVARQLIDFEAIGNDDIRRVYSSVALPHGGVTVLFGVPAASTLGWIEQDLITRILSLAGIWLTGIAAAWLGTQRLVIRWTSALRRMARSYGRGDFSAKLDLRKAPSELNDLGNTMMLMAGRIEAREEELRQSLAQKDVLLREIHHRVKNNLQIVTSLLNIHGKSVHEPAARNALEEVKTRVRALALVHRYLYESEDLQLVDLQSFMSELCRTLFNSLSDGSDRISVSVELPRLLILSDRAVPMALLVTEAVTNALKHAFPAGRRGAITVSFRFDEPGTGILTVADDGVGLPTADPGTGSLGLHLIEAFAKQVDGRLTLSGPPGTVITLVVDLHHLTGKGDLADHTRHGARSAA